MLTVLSDFDASLDRIRAVAADMDQRILTASPEERLRDETMRCAATVILSGFFESFLKDCIQSYISFVCSRKVPFARLGDKMQRQHFVAGGQLLAMKYRSDGRVSWVTSDHLDIARRLASPCGPKPEYTLLWEAFASTGGNPGPSVILEILERLGVDKREKRLSEASGGMYSSLKLSLASFIEVRNECAHTGTALNVPSSNDLVRYCDMLHEIATAFVNVLEKRMSEPPLGVNLNTAGAAELAKIPGFGQTRIAALLNYRTTNGGFSRVEDAAAIPGIGRSLAGVLRRYAHV